VPEAKTTRGGLREIEEKESVRMERRVLDENESGKKIEGREPKRTRKKKSHKRVKRVGKKGSGARQSQEAGKRR